MHRTLGSPALDKELKLSLRENEFQLEKRFFAAACHYALHCMAAGDFKLPIVDVIIALADGQVKCAVVV